MSSFYLKSRQSDLDIFQSLAYNSGMDSFETSDQTIMTEEQIQEMAETAWFSATMVEDWQSDDPAEINYLEGGEGYAKPYYVAAWANGWRDAQENWLHDDHEFRLAAPIYTATGNHADAILVRDRDVWLGEYDAEMEQVVPLVDEGGDYIPAPDGWQFQIAEMVS